MRTKSMLKKYRNIPNQKGLTLLELLLAIGLVAVVIGVAIYIFGGAQSGTNAYKGTQNVLTISAAVKGLYPTPNYNGVSAAVIASSKKVPDVYVSGANLVNPWGQNITVAAVNVGTGTNNGFTITDPGIPTNECNSIASAVQSNFQKLTIGATVVKDDTAATPVVYSPGAAATACAAAASNSLIFQGT